VTAERTSIASALRAAADTLTQLADQIENEEGRPFEALSALESGSDVPDALRACRFGPVHLSDGHAVAAQVPGQPGAVGPWVLPPDGGYSSAQAS
jgi:hypothetical protein